MNEDERDRARAVLDLQEGRGPVPVLDDDGALEVLRRARRIAIVGASVRPDRPSNDVMRFLLARGYDCVPITPTADEVLGVRAYPTIVEATAATGSFDIVDVFRRPEHCPVHAADAVAAGAGCLWLQLGIVNWAAAHVAHDGRLTVVMDRCTAIEYGRLAGRQR